LLGFNIINALDGDPLSRLRHREQPQLL
jgi:hypothetical protein